MKINYTLRTAGLSLLFALTALFGFNQQTFAEANYVYHEATTNNPGCGPNYRSVVTPNSSQTLTVAWKVEFQFYTDNVRLYYTTDGSTPSGAFGVGTGTTQVLVGSYNCTFGGPVVDVVTATIPAFAAGKTVKYILSAWHSAGGDEIFANGPGAPCSCGTPTNNSSLATVFSYTVANANNVEVSATTGTTIGSYSTLKGAFDAINAGTHTGTIAISIYGNTTETASAVLNASGSGSASYSSISVKPAGGAARSVTGAIAGNLIDLNGADNVTIDGLNTGGNSLTLENTDISTSATTLRFISDATSNTVLNCTIKGAGSSTTLGTIFFSTGTTTGNDGNNITNNSITASGANFATNAIYSSGTSPAIDNSGISISGNNISDYFNAASVSIGINVGATGNSAWTITNNKLFQTATRIFSTGNTHSGIFVGVGSGYTISGNTIGFANASGTGTTNLLGNTTAVTGTFPTSYTVTTTNANTTRYIAINCAFTAGGSVSNIQGNTVAGIALYTSSGATTTNGILCGINVTSGNANIGTTSGNTIGTSSGQSSLYGITTTTGGTVVGIFATSTNTVTIQNNTIGAVDAVGSSASISGGFTGIDAAGTGGIFTISSNTIGNTTADNIRTGYTLSGGNLSNAGTLTSTTGATAAIVSIRSAASGATLTLSSNTIRGIATSGTVTAVTGITSTGGNTSSVTINSNSFGTSSLDWMRYAFANSGSLIGINLTGSTAATTHSIQTNDFRGITYSVAGTGSNTYITTTAGTAANDVTTLSNNTFTNLNVNTTGSVTFISHSYTMSSTGTQTINNNSIVTAFNKGGAGGTVTVTTTNGSSVNGSLCSITNNNFSNITVTGGTGITGINNTDGLSGGTSAKTITGNTFNAWTGGTSAILGINVSYFHTGTSTVSSNSFTNITGQGSITGISINSSANSATSLSISSNTINNLSSTGSGSSVTGITCANTSPTISINGNTISTLSTTAGSAVTGIAVTAATTTNVFKNKIYDLSGSNASTTVNGILISGGTTVSAYNNLIGDLRTNFANAANPLNGINITGGTTVNAYYNTVRLSATSAGATFGSSAISASTSPALTLRNNILINNSTSNGTGLSVAYRRSSTTLTSYASGSDRNIYFAPTIYNDGTNSYTLSTFKALVTPRDANSQTENVAFISVTGSSSNFLHPVGTQTYAESGGSNISGITDDFDGDVRQGNGGYAGTGTAPDIGGDEFNGTPPPVCSGTPTAGVISGASSVCSGTGTTLTLTGASTDIGITYQWKFSTTQGGPYTNNLGTGSTQATGNLTVATYYVVTVTCTQGGGGTATTSEFAVGINAAPTVSVSSNPSNATICGSGSVSMTASASTSSTSRTVLVQNFSFTPPTMNVNVGDVIHFVWVNGVHTTTSSSVPGGAATWDAPLSSGSPTFDYTVTTAGTYNYFCTIHGAGVMSGTFTAGNPTYTWAPSTGLNTTTGASVTASPTSTTTYTVTATNGVGCTGTGTKTVSVGPTLSVTSVTATPNSVCSGGSSALNAVATSSAIGYTVSSITPTPLTPTGSPTILATGGVATPAPGGFSLDDGYWDGISLPFTFTFFGVSTNTVRIGTNGNVQFGSVVNTGRNPGNSSYTPQTIPSGGAIGSTNYMDNFIGGPWLDQDLSSTPFGTVRYFTNGSSPNRQFVVSFEAVHVFNSSDNNTSQIILNENGSTIDVLLLGSGLTAGTTKAIGVENVDGTIGIAAPNRNAGTWTTTADEGWRFTPAATNYVWSPSTFLNNASISNPTASNVTSTTTYTVTASDATVSACTATGTVTLTSVANVTYYQDNDNDTYGNPAVSQTTCTGAPAGYVANNTDCNDNNNAVHPGVAEVCNTIDDNCNSQIDEGVQSTFYADADNDSYGNVAVTTLACTAPPGYVANSTDCNDGNPAVNPGATETCNSIDDDCDTQIDEGVQSTFYADADNDFYGNAAVTTLACTTPAGYVSNSTDCNDGNAAVNPGAAEICNSIDDDCDTQIDEGVQSTFYADADNDTYGNAAASTLACSAPVGYVSDNTDCNDGNENIHPGATEVCNTIDDDCDTQIDEGVQSTFYADSDNDTYGNAAVTTMACSAPAGYVSDNTDCNDNDVAVHALQSFYIDGDNDTYGSTNTSLVCAITPPTGYSNNNTDCNDANGNINPGATEQCNGVDDNCDGAVDEGCTVFTYFADADNDTYGDPNNSTTSVSNTAPAGYVSNNTDCNDGNAAVSPGASEVCNTIDDDCDGFIDEGVQSTFYADADNDTYGSATVTALACSAPAGYVSNNTDCNDNDASVHTPQQFYVDADHDGYGSTTPSMLCSSTAPTGYSTNNTDCNDGNSSIHPNQSDMCNSVDDDCDGSVDEDATFTTWYRDADADTYGNSAIAQSACSQPSGYVSNNTDCNDGNSAIHPGATDICNNIDDDCDASIDEDATFSTWYADADNDNYGNAASTTSACSQPSGYVSNNTDCNDANAAIHPGAQELCNGIDDDCDGATDNVASPVASFTASCSALFPGNSSILTSTSTAGSGTIVSYQWILNGNSISSATNSTYTTGVNANGNYSLRVTNSNSCSNTSGATSITNLSGALAGSYTIPSNCGFTSINNAVTYINTNGISASVTFNVTAGYTETAPSGGISLTATGTSTNTITFQKSGSGANPIINAYTGGTGTSATAIQDGIWKLVGSDFVTIDGIDLNDGNTANPATMEFGYGLYKSSATNGCQNVTIQNCTITLNRINVTAGTAPAPDGSTGIEATNAIPSAATTVLTVTAASGTNSNDHFYHNTIQNCNTGISIIGFAGATPFTTCDQTNDVGGGSAATGNTIVNFGGGTGAAVSALGVRTLAQYGVNISFNTINSNNGSGVNHVSLISGIVNGAATSASGTINNNIITVKGGGTTSAISGISNGAGATAAGNTININNNTITNCTYTTATSGSFTGITNSASAATVNINGNAFTSNATNGTTSATTFISCIGASTVAININNNNINGWTFNAANSGTLLGISNTGGTSTAAVSIQTNNFQGITYTAVSSGTHTYITSTAATLTNNISNNTFTNLNLNTTGSVTFISHSYSMPAGGSQTFNNNSIVTAFNKAGAGGTITFTTTNGSSPNTSTAAYTNNNFSNITLTGATAITGFNNTDGGTAPTKTITGNIFNNWTTGAATITAMNFAYWSGTTSILSTNTITNITGQGAITAVNIGASAVTANPATIATNTITGLSSTGTGGNVTGITCSNTSPLVNISSNTINTLSSTGASSTVVGIAVTGATSTNVFSNTIRALSGSGATSPVTNGISVSAGATVNVFKNSISNLLESGTISTTSPAVNGMVFSGGTTINAFNNRIGDLRATAASLTDAVRGISITSSTASTSYNVVYNTVYLAATSSGANFGTSGIFHTTSTTATTAALTLGDNMIVNNSTPNGTGLTVAYRRSSAALTNYGSLSNYNLFYAGTAGASNLIFYDGGTNSDQTLAAYQAVVSPRDNFSVSQNPTFLSVTSGNSNFLKMDASVPSLAESGGLNITGITDDFDGDIRQGNAGYAGSGSAPDIGADEFAGVSPVPQITNVTVPTGGNCSSVSHVINADITTATGSITSVVLNYNNGAAGSTNMTFVSGNTYTGTIPGASPTNTNVTWSITATNTVPFSKTFTGVTYNDATPLTANAVTISASPAAFCGTGGTSTLTAASNDANYAYTWASAGSGTLSTTTGPATNATVTVTSSFIVTAVDGACQSSVTYSLGVYIFPTVVPSASPATVCAGSSSTLSSGVSSLGFSVNSISYAGMALPGSGVTTLCAAGVQLVTPTTISIALDDAVWGGVPLGFNFNFFGNTYSTVNISTNGNLQFTTQTTTFTPGSLPTTAITNFIAPFWTDLYEVLPATSGFGIIRYWTTGTSPNRIFVAEYSNCGHYNSGTTPTAYFTGQVWLYETTGQVEVHIASITGNGSPNTYTWSTGVNNLDGTIGAAAPNRNNNESGSNLNTTNESWHFEPPHNYTYNWQPSGQITGSNTTTSVTASPTTMPYTAYTVLISDPVTTCSRTFNDTVFVQPIPSPPTVTPSSLNIVAGDPVSFTASGAGGATFHVYDAPAGGNLLFTGSSYSGAGPCVTTHYYVDQVTGVCASPTRTDVTINVTPISSPTITGNLNVCGISTTTLTSSSPAAGHTIKWYTASTGGTLVNTGTTFTTPALNATTTYYVGDEQAICSSVRTAVTVNWMAAPSITVTNPTPAFCGSASITPVNLSVSSSDNSYAYNWTESVSGTLNTLSGSSVTANVTTTTNYTVTAVNSGTGCSTAAITAISVFSFSAFNATATPSSICSGQSSQISAGVTATTFNVASIPYAPHSAPGTAINLANGGTAVTTQTSGSLDDGGWANVPIGFNFNFFGNIYSTVNVGTNGVLQFGAYNTTQIAQYSFPNGIPSTGTPANIIAVTAADYVWSATGTIRYWTEGSSPNRIFGLEYSGGVGFLNGSDNMGTLTVQCLLYETTGIVEIHLTNDDIQQYPGGGSWPQSWTKTIGVQDATQTIGSTAPNRNAYTPTITVPEAWRFSPPVNYTFSWTPTGSLDNPSSGTPVASPTTTTLYHVLITDPITNCQKTDTVTVHVIGAPPTVTVTPSSSTICSPGGSAVTLHASGDPATYTWAPSTGLNSSTGSSVNSLPSSTTTYTVTATSAVGCVSTSSPVSVAIVNAPVISSVTATPPGVCVGGSSTLVTTVSGPSTYCANSNTTNTIYGIDTFYTTGGTSNIANYASGFSTSGYGDFTSMIVSQAVGATVNFHLKGLATYTYGWGIWVDWNQDGTFTAGEQMYSSGAYINSVSGSFVVPAGSLNGNTRMRVVADDLNTVPPACDNSAYNETEDYTFNVTGGVTVNYSYTWSPATFLNSTTGSTVTANGVTTTTSYTVTVSDGICSSTGGVTVNSGAVGVNPTSVQTSSGAACTGSTFQLSSGLTGGGFPYTYTWAPATGLNNATISNPVATVASTTTYTLSVTDNCGSSASGTVTITVSPVPSVVVTPNNPNICSGTTIALTASGDVATYAWSPAAGLNSTTGSTVNASPTSTRTYTVVATAGSGCTSTISTTVSVVSSPLFSSVTATPATICPGGSSQLQATTVDPNSSGVSGYLFTAVNGSFTPLAGSTALSLASGSVDDGLFSVVPLTFSFNYGGAAYTQVVPSTNGTMFFGTAGTTTTVNSLTSNSPRPFVAPLSDDEDAVSAAVSYIVTGTAGNHVFTMEWLNMEWYYNVGGGATISYQCKLYEATGQIEFIYQQESGALGGVSEGASIGLAGLATGNFLSLDNSSASPTPSSSTETTTINTKPATGQIYRFTPPVATGVSYAWSPTTFLNDATINNPMASGLPGTTTYTVTATIGNGCSASSAVTVNVADTTFVGLNPDYCEGDGAVFITPNTPGGTFSGTGVSPYQGGAVFDPAVSGVGTFVVSYSLPYGCGSSQTVTVHPIPTVTLESFAPTCSNTPPFILMGGSPTGGTYFDQFGYVTNGNTFDPGAAGAGTHTIFYAYSDPYGCSAFAQGDITVSNPTITVYADNDNDGYGTGDPMLVCVQPAGTSLNNTDCNDNDGTVHTPQLYYVDADHDDYGSTTSAMLCSSTPPTGYSTNNTDCNDSNGSIHPGAPEQCNGIDDNCNGQVDESLNFITFYADVDADTYGNPAVSVVSCVQPTGFVEDNTDCNDNDATVHSPQLYYVDADHDTFGSATTAMLCSSTAPTGYSTNNTDCNDNDATVHTSQPYYIDVDQDGYGSAATAMICSSTAPTGYSTDNTDCNDNDATVHTPQLYYVDADHDSYGSTTSAMLCSSTAPTGYSTNNTDCNDNDATVHAPQLYYVDADQDSYGSTITAMLCSSTVPTGYSTNNTDCNDNNAAINPVAIEVCGNGLDDNCNGQMDENCILYTYYADVDADTYGNPASSITSYSNIPPAGYVADNTDCNDNDPTVHTPQQYYVDADQDGFGSTVIAMLCSSTAPTGYSTNNTDCNDNDATVHSPQLYYVDTDHDGYGSTTTAMLCSSTAPTGYSTNNTDCNDNNAAVNPGATDICNGIDDNCNGTVDENPLVATVTPNGTVTYCRNIPVTLSANTGVGITYQWYKGVSPQSGETNSTFTTVKRGSFKVVETTGYCTSTSAYTSVARIATPQAAITVYGSTDICSTGSVILRANNAGSNNTTHTYQWNKGGLAIIGATDRIYTATSTGSYTVTVINSNGCSTTSSPVTVTSSCKETQDALISAKLNLYPNPTHGTFNVELKLNEDVNVEADIQIINELGQSIFLNRTAVVNGELFDEITFDKTIPSGNYFVRILAGDKVYTGKIVYQK